MSYQIQMYSCNGNWPKRFHDHEELGYTRNAVVNLERKLQIFCKDAKFGK